ncbi:MAG TPA: UDP-glucose/GDP-mannose dehydrogenase family protein [Saprospiraceae bacterium]|nr:UDP-glucose/GDP-mannose dehydrogenase family protein [Saprospiraceae bacterium]MBX7180354.1 UDP-glucose/GDP-mannose dehydrogenase family protein [Saprospiraceae bacterium]MCO5283751.1 UDP-glucose/GDP-mannose dehydrogenase family protein [Saprospiraceae bacterium]MCO6470686.1 UDP-glucose/GDP-mannose dehydrogenase family protein [Saprospiraceae bacterium]WKZ64446.1 MAG: UDP-glucose/GDP-mannose dehydrogenase family protein [Saprospiraceae bacterium]
MNISVIGTGYVGLVTGTCFSETGNSVMCVDIDENKVNSLKSGVITIYEPGLEVIFQRNLEKKRLEFTTDLKKAVDFADIIFLALPTPEGEDGSADLSYVLNVANQLGKMISSYKIIVDKSTVPVGTADLVHQAIAQNAAAELFDVVSNPEFLREGVAVEDFMKPDRVVIGTSSPRAREIIHRLYEPFVKQGNPIYFMDERSAEMTKYAANSFLATKITFMNEIANLCERVGANVDMVRLGMGADSRIGKRFLFPGIGYGGSCFPKDVKALHKIADQNDFNFRILDAVIQVNINQRTILFDKLHNFYKGNLNGKTIAIWGLSFKPNTDDIREAPALYIIDKLLDAGAKIRVFDPEAMDNVRRIYGEKLFYAVDQYEVLSDCDALMIMTEWNEFRSPQFDSMFHSIKDKVIFDGRNIFDPKEMQEKGFNYESIGRPV